MVHINAKIKNGIQRFINIAILCESHKWNFSGVMWTTTVYFLHLNYKYVECMGIMVFKTINHNIALDEKAWLQAQKHVS